MPQDKPTDQDRFDSPVISILLFLFALSAEALDILGEDAQHCWLIEHVRLGDSCVTGESNQNIWPYRPPENKRPDSVIGYTARLGIVGIWKGRIFLPRLPFHNTENCHTVRAPQTGMHCGKMALVCHVLLNGCITCITVRPHDCVKSPQCEGFFRFSHIASCMFKQPRWLNTQYIVYFFYCKPVFTLYVVF